MNRSNRMLVIKFPYWLGIIADAIWVAGLFSPAAFSLLTGNPDFKPDIQTRLIMAIGGTLMAGWTLLLIWAVKEPVGRRMVILLTAYPVVLGMLVIAAIGFFNGSSSNIILIIKTIILMITMTISYMLAGKIEKENMSKDFTDIV